MPIRLIFSEEGVAYFSSRGTKLSRFKTSTSQREYGVFMRTYTPETVQRMLLEGYVTQIDFSLEDTESGSRKNIIDLTKLLTYAVLYRQFDTIIYNELLRSDMIKHWNRINPRNPIDIKTQINKNSIVRYIEKHRNDIHQIRNAILTDIHGFVRHNAFLKEGEREVMVFLSERLLSHVNPLLWVILTMYSDSDDYHHLLGFIRDTIRTYLDKSSVAEYLSLMIIELVVFLRPSMFQEGKPTPGHMRISYKLSRARQIMDDRAKLHVIIRDTMKTEEGIKDAINTRANVIVKEKSLKDFYQGANSDQIQMSLGLYYLSYLKDACKNMQILFDSFVNQIGSEETEIHLSLVF